MSADDNRPIPIPGSAGACIYAALHALAMRPEAAALTIRKERAAGGGYVYSVSNITAPATAKR